MRARTSAWRWRTRAWERRRAAGRLRTGAGAQLAWAGRARSEAAAAAAVVGPGASPGADLRSAAGAVLGAGEPEGVHGGVEVALGLRAGAYGRGDPYVDHLAVLGPAQVVGVARTAVLGAAAPDERPEPGLEP